ncbi:hypothetical protein [Pseudomonas sp. C9]|jgi:hypothetical protein|uniref:hypothetical protein n=1 Tax=Pseudomonas sp. C9 TaxID=1311337 RepID=UPI0009874DC0|nr:hypothetical protein [Pseudomonas sp. C9]OOG14522.1 hypothetical protein BMS17_21255 [Pseudomonas sp. C9]
MFDLTKDLATYGGIPPYASEHYGVYQPLLGWQSKLSKKWIERGGILVDPRVKRILDGRITPGPTSVNNSPTLEFIADPLEPGAGKSPFKVRLTKDLGSQLVLIVLAKVQAFVDAHAGKLPAGPEWGQLIEINNLLDKDKGDLRKANDAARALANQQLLQSAGQSPTKAMIEQSRRDFLVTMQYESQIATLLLALAEGQAGVNPDELRKLFSVDEAPPLSDILLPTDPLANIDPADRTGALAPVGFVHLFRQYFFDLGTFIGEPVEHVWLAPATTIELIEVSTRKTMLERTDEISQESTTRSELSETSKDELSDAVKEENTSSTKLGVSNTNTVKFGVYQGTVSASFGLESTRKEGRETTHKQSREQAEKLSTEIKRSYKSVFKTTTETTDTRSRRYVLQNPSNKLINYELRRKMRRVGVQMQDVGVRLCWQIFVDDPGSTLGLADLVHMVESPDLASIKEPDLIPRPAAISKKVVVPIPFSPILNYSNNHANYAYSYLETANTQYKGKHLSIIKGDDEDDDSQTIFGPFPFKFDPPQANYVLSEVRSVGVQGNKQAVIKFPPQPTTDGSFEIVMNFVNFGGENQVNLELELIYQPTSDEITRVDTINAANQGKYNAEVQRLYKKTVLENVRARIKDASNVRQRSTVALREEERTIVYRKLIERLMLDSWKLPDTPENRRLSHVRSEIVRSLFDIDAMLYFVAPEWWMPQRRTGQLDLNVNLDGNRYSLTDGDSSRWGGEKRSANYNITEDSAPAKLGASLGWLMQLDGDNLRNAFLNAPWAKAVVPIRPGREVAALNWLRSIEGHENDGWDTPYLGTSAEDAQYAGKTVGEVLQIIAEKLTAENGDIQNTLAADKVFQSGFDPLADGFNAGLPPNQVFSQWITVLPTDQIVAVEYKPIDLNM